MPTVLHVLAIALDVTLFLLVLAWYWRNYLPGGRFHPQNYDPQEDPE